MKNFYPTYPGGIEIWLARGRPSARIRPLPAFQQRAGAAYWAMALQSSMRVPRNFEAWAMLVDSQAIMMG